MNDDIISDDELVAKLRNPESRNYGFNLLVRKYQERLYWHIRKMVIDHEDADDLLQDTFIKIFNNLEKFRGDSMLFTWVYKIASNTCLSHLSSKRRRFFIPLHDVAAELSSKLESSSYIDGEAVQLKLHKALLQLPDKQRMVFNMKYYDEMKYEEIAEITETSVGALKANYHHAVKKIENLLKED